MSKKRYMVRINISNHSIASCDECNHESQTDYINGGYYYVVVEASNPKDAQRIGYSHYNAAKAEI